MTDDLHAVWRDDQLIEAAARGELYDHDDPAAGPLRALAGLADSGPLPVLDVDMAVRAETRRNHRYAVRSLAVAVTAVATLSTSGVAAVVTGDPLRPAKAVWQEIRDHTVGRVAGEPQNVDAGRALGAPVRPVGPPANDARAADPVASAPAVPAGIAGTAVHRAGPVPAPAPAGDDSPGDQAEQSAQETGTTRDRPDEASADETATGESAYEGAGESTDEREPHAGDAEPASRDRQRDDDDSGPGEEHYDERDEPSQPPTSDPDEGSEQPAPGEERDKERPRPVILPGPDGERDRDARRAPDEPGPGDDVARGQPLSTEPSSPDASAEPPSVADTPVEFPPAPDTAGSTDTTASADTATRSTGDGDTSSGRVRS
jgi:hypothetical protein